MSNEHKIYLKKIKITKIKIRLLQFIIIISFLSIWEFTAKSNIINEFIFSSPSNIINQIINLVKTNNLYNNINTTVMELLISFTLSTIISFFLALLLYLKPFIKKVLDPFITLTNSLPKVALGPLIIIWVGANQKSIILMSLLISVLTSLITILNGFLNTNKDQIKLFKIYNSTKIDLLTKLIIPSSRKEIISSLKLNLSLSLIGIISGEFLSCKEGIGYLIIYGTQIFNLSLVATGIILLMIISFVFYLIINYIDKRTSKN